jgi:hypothetical protein
MPVVDIKGVGKAKFPDEMMTNDIRTFLRQKYLPELSRQDALTPRPATMQASNPSLATRAATAIGEGLNSAGIISDRFGAQQIGKNVTNIGEFLPGIGDATAGDEFGRALKQGDNFGMALGALGAIPLVGDAAKKVVGKAADPKTWYHGTNNYFNEFESSFLGSSNPAKDSKLGFYFSKSEDTANAYRNVTPNIKPEKFKQQYGRTMDEQKERIDKASERFESVFGIGFDDFKSLPRKERVDLENTTANLKQGAKQITDAKSTLNPYTYESFPYSMDEWIDEEKGGRLIEANIPDSELMEFDYMGQPWDENRQHLIAKEAQEKGFKGVLFKDMQDSGWFGGQGIDDVALIFNPSDIKQTNKAAK